MTLTLLHDRYFSSPLTATLTTEEAYHWGRSLSLYSKALASGVRPSSRDALWATAAFLGVLSLTHTDARIPEESWPYAPPSPLDLNWLRMSEGKKEIWKDAQEFMAESDFKLLAVKQDGQYQPPLTYSSAEGLLALPQDFLDYFDIREETNLIDNPYFAAVNTFAQTWNATTVLEIFTNWIFYITNMEQRHKTLLEQKDPRALLLLAYWYKIVYDTGHWYMRRRSSLERESICLYLETYHGNDFALQELLDFPRGVRSPCGTDQLYYGSSDRSPHTSE